MTVPAECFFGLTAKQSFAKLQYCVNFDAGSQLQWEAVNVQKTERDVTGIGPKG